MHQEKISILFVINQAKTNQKGICPIYCRITINKNRKQFSVGNSINPKDWNSKKQLAESKLIDYKSLNAKLSIVKQKLNNIYLKQLIENNSVEVDEIINLYFKKASKKEDSVISYLTNNEQLVECLNTVNNHLNEKGIFIFDVWYTPAVYMQKPETRVKRISDNAIQGTRIAESTIHFNENVVDVNYEIHIQNKANGITEVYQEKHPMRHFSIPEIALLAELTNFTVIKTEEFGTQEKPSENTWGVCFVLQKK